ncbi:MAG: peptidase M28 family protein, partial [Marinilabiliales bacterium]
IGGHLDSWFNSQGAHDDGGGCIQSLEVARLFYAVGYIPQNTIRIVMFLDEEMAQRGARAYADNPLNASEQHYFALESDRGVTCPTGFSFDGPDMVVKKLKSWAPLFEPYGLHRFYEGGSGVDISFLKKHGTMLAALVTESQRYFDFHHSANDTWNQVNRREMQLGSAAMAALIYLVDKYGLY